MRPKKVSTTCGDEMANGSNFCSWEIELLIKAAVSHVSNKDCDWLCCNITQEIVQSHRLPFCPQEYIYYLRANQDIHVERCAGNVISHKRFILQTMFILTNGFEELILFECFARVHRKKITKAELEFAFLAFTAA